MSDGGARAEAARLLARISAGASLSAALAPAAEKLSPAVRPLFQELVYSTLREWPRLEAIANALLAKPLRRKDGDVMALVLVGLQQLSGSRIAAHAAVSETVAAARGLGKPWAVGLVNGVLRNYQRRGGEVEASLDAAAGAALPAWLHDQIASEWPGQLAHIVAASRSHPAFTLRVNRLHIARDDYLALLAAREDLSSHSAVAVAGVADAITLTPASDVSKLPGFAEGWVSVQDAAAQLACEFLAPVAGERLLDACAAPGGKTCHLLERAPDIAELVAADISKARLARVGDNARRLGLTPRLLTLDASAVGAQLPPASFDAILVDAPCSATGVMRRNPDIKLHRRAGDIAGFAAQQQAILRGVWPLLKPGGRLLYVTCSILEAENDAAVAALVAAVEDVEVEPLSHALALPRRFGVQTLPQAGGHDGLYFARLRKASV